jgi:hypothetical protein
MYNISLRVSKNTVTVNYNEGKSYKIDRLELAKALQSLRKTYLFCNMSGEISVGVSGQPYLGNYTLWLPEPENDNKRFGFSVTEKFVDKVMEILYR